MSAQDCFCKPRPCDRTTHVLAAAAIANTSIIVTNNITDFDARALTPWNIKAQLPEDFREKLSAFLD